MARQMTEIPAAARILNFGREEKNLGQMAYDQILEMLIKRELPVGSVLQERRVSEALGMSRTPTREAFYRLETEGYIARQAGGLLVVREFTTRELIEILHVRRVLEVEAVSLALGRIPDAELDAAQAAVNQLLSGPSPTVEEDWAVDSRLHGMIAKASGNDVIHNMVNALRLKTHMFNKDRVPERFEVGHLEHLEIIEALRTRNRSRATELMSTHIENVKKSIISKISQP
jgi:DNA-binding GntR family transcriptional regulator